MISNSQLPAANPTQQTYRSRLSRPDTMQANAEAIRQVVQEVLAQLGKAPKSAAAPQDGDWGVFQSVDQAVAAANEGFKKLSESPLASRATATTTARPTTATSPTAEPRTAISTASTTILRPIRPTWAAASFRSPIARRSASRSGRTAGRCSVHSRRRCASVQTTKPAARTAPAGKARLRVPPPRRRSR